jgi:hypothetical protein
VLRHLVHVLSRTGAGPIGPAPTRYGLSDLLRFTQLHAVRA